MTAHSRVRLAALAVGALVSVGVAAVDAEAGVLRFEPVADAHVNGAKPKANFGRSKTLVVDGSPVVRSYLRFNLRGLGGSVSYATLQLSVMNSSAAGLAVRRAAVNNWGERAIRYTNAPRVLPKPTAKSRKVKSFRAANISVTKLVRRNGPVTLVVIARGRGAARFASGEGPKILRPSLVVGTNSAPTCLPLVLSTSEDTAGTLDPACSDAERDRLSYQIVSKGSLGAASIVGGKLRYAPKANAYGTDRFVYRAKDARKRSKRAAVTVIIRPVNDAPICTARTLTVDEDSGAAVAARCTDIDGDPLSYSITAAAQRGSTQVVGGELRYVPQANTNGADSFMFRARDTTLPSAPATVSVTVRPVNDAPACGAVSLATFEDVVGEAGPACSDIDGDALAYGIAGQGTKGSAWADGGKLRYAPNANLNGGDVFTYFASDGAAASAPATASVSIAAVNDAPVCQPTQLDTPENTPGQVNPNCNDVEGEALTYFINSQGTMGTASVTAAGILRYVPHLPNDPGADSFTYGARDPSLAASAPATVSVTIGAVNDAPACSNVPLQTDEDVAGERDPVCTDAENALLTFSIVSQGSKGTASITAANKLRYVPNLNATGADTFTYRASDGNQWSVPATVSVTILPVNDAPSCGPRTLVVDEDATQGNVAPACADPEGDPMTFEIVQSPGKGTASVVGVSLQYVPNANANGSDSFTYRAKDPSLAGAAATVSVTINPINDAPVAQGQSASTPEDTAKDLTLVATDIDVGDTLTFTIVSGPAHGTLSGTGASRTYTPDANYNGPDSFTFRAIDSHLANSNVATVSLTVDPVNDAPPVCANVTLTTNEEVSKDQNPNCTDVDGDALTYSIVSQGTKGIASVAAGKLRYTPSLNLNGPDSFTYWAGDGVATSPAATVSVTIAAVNDAPTCQPFTLGTNEDTDGLTFADCSDVDEDPLTYAIIAQGGKGTASVEPDGRLRYAPALNEHGADSFTFTVSDGVITTNPQTAQVAIAAVNDAPTCNPVVLTTPINTPGFTSPECADVDGNPLTFEIVTQPAIGTAALNGAELHYTPALGYTGADLFTYRAGDGSLFSPPANVSVTVTP